ncbi:MAG: hypothetical protein KJ607_00385 [Bacteroidetes bacterium]|nr:hypothetical protein [Bacteroidota bacterium]
MRKNIMTFFLFIFAPCLLHATGENIESGAKQAGMGGASVMISDVWSVYNNQAGLARVKDITFGAYYASEFLQPELGFKTMAFALPVQFGTFGVSLSHFGYSSYGETRAGLAYSKAFGERYAMGIQLNYFNLNLPEYYGNRGTAFAEVGFFSEPIDNLYVGAHVFNPTRAKIADYNDERLPTVIRFGAGYNFSDKVIVSAEASKDLVYDMVVRAGIDYHILKNLYIRAGISSQPESRYGFGVGYEVKGFRADFAFCQHYILGFTPHFSLSYTFGKKEVSHESF